MTIFLLICKFIFIFLITIIAMLFLLEFEYIKSLLYVTKKRLVLFLIGVAYEYAIFAQGVGMSVSGFTLVELAKDYTTVSTYELVFIFFLGLAIFEISRRVKIKLKN